MNEHYFYWMSLFSLGSRLLGEPCHLFSLINYSCPELRCIFCIACCQQISISNKQIESSINLIKQIGKLFKIWWSEGWIFKEGTLKIKVLNWGTTEHSDSFHRNKRMCTHWEGLNIFLYAKIQWAQTMAIICIWWNYFDIIRNPSPNTLLRLTNCMIIHR